MKIGRVLRTARKNAGLSQADVAGAMGCEPCYVSRLENGHTEPTLKTIRRFARAVDVRPGALVDQSERIKRYPNRDGNAIRKLPPSRRRSEGRMTAMGFYLNPTEKTLRHFDTCFCGDYRHQHGISGNRCFCGCLEFRLHAKATEVNQVYTKEFWKDTPHAK